MEMIKTKRLILRPLAVVDAGMVSQLLKDQPENYSRFFYAIDKDAVAIAEVISSAVFDVYSGIFWQSELIGIFMLRGWDAGFKIPSFGVLIGEKYRGLAFMKLSLDAAKLTARLAGAKKLMAKIHPENLTPRGAGRLGFIQTGIEESTGNIIYHLEL